MGRTYVDPIREAHKRRFDHFLKPKAQAWTPPPPPSGAPKLITDLPAELRNKVYDLALPNEDHGKIVLLESPFEDSGTYEPSLLLTCKQVRYEAGYVWYSTRIFSMNLSIDPPKMAWTLRKLEGIISLHGPRAFKQGITFRLLPSVERKPAGIVDLVDLVRRTGVDLLPPDLRFDLVPQVTDISAYSSYQTAMSRLHPRTAVTTFLLLGLVAHREGWSYVRLLREIRRHDTAVKKGLWIGLFLEHKYFMLRVPLENEMVLYQSF